MNSLETDYSFLAPTWKLPSIATTSMYPGTYGTSHLSSPPPTGNNTMHNPRYIPPAANRRANPVTKSQPVQFGPHPSHQQKPNRNSENFNDHLDFTVNVHSNNESTQFAHSQPHQMDNRKLSYPSKPVQKRVQIIDPNRQTPSTDHLSGRESGNSHSRTPDFDQIQHKPKPNHDYIDDNKSDSTYINIQRPNNFNVHEYLYGLSAPDPGSYVSAYKNQRRRLQDDKVVHKTVMTDYKNFVQNGGFGPTFGNGNSQTYEEKLDTEMKRKSYSKIVRETNQYKIEEQKRVQNNGGQQRNRTTAAVPLPKHRRPDATRSHFISAQEVREFERKIKREHDANCKCSLHAKPHHSSA